MIEKSLLAGVDWAYFQEQSFLEEIAPEELNVEGNFSSWSARDLVAHVAEYRRNIGDFLLRLKKEGTERADYTPVEPIDARNRRIYDANHSFTLEQIRAQSRASWLRVKEAVLDVGSGFLEEPESSRLLWSNKTDALWRRTVYGEAIYHPMGHLFSYHERHGRNDRAGDLRQNFGSQMRTLGLT